MVADFYKEYFYNEMTDGVEKLESYINCELERFLKYDDVIELIDKCLGSQNG